MLLDSNIIIYAAQPKYVALRNWLESQWYAVSDLTRLEVLGYHKLNRQHSEYFHHFFIYCPRYPISSEVIDKAITIRRNYAMSLGDAIIGATAFHHNLKLCTNNMMDFQAVKELEFVPVANYL